MNLCLKSLGELSSTKRLIPKETVGCSARWLCENLWEECHPVSRGAIMARKRHFQVLVQRSSGQFIDATTVLKFVGADFCSPTKRPALTLKRDPTAFSDLDQLYTQMLSIQAQRTLSKLWELSWHLTTIRNQGWLKIFSGSVEDENDKNGAYSNTGDVSPHFAHASFSNICSIQVARPGPMIPCQSTGIWKPDYSTELCTHYSIDSVLELSNSCYYLESAY